MAVCKGCGLNRKGYDKFDVKVGRLFGEICNCGNYYCGQCAGVGSQCDKCDNILENNYTCGVDVNRDNIAVLQGVEFNEKGQTVRICHIADFQLAGIYPVRSKDD